MIKDYEMVIGLEVHVELKTESKIFCACGTSFGAEPNTQVCPVCLGLPGTLPVLNTKVVDYAIKAGLATHCSITKDGKQDRKNYFYPDLAKAYQISQYDQPICQEGYIEISEDQTKKIGITRIHIEEDAGKLIHHPEKGTLIDYNRAGVPLIEIVSEPDLRSAKEAKAYLQKLRGVLLYTEVSDCKMNEGSFRCDVNLSVRKKGTSVLGTRTEMKNLNSFSSITKAIEHEFTRQVKLIESGGQVDQETRKWDQDKNKSVSMRSKEDAQDYRYFPDPDLMPIIIDDQHIETLKASLPELPDSRILRYLEKTIKRKDAELIVIDRSLSDYFDDVLKEDVSAGLAASLLITSLKKYRDDEKELPISAESFAQVITFLESGQLNNSLAKKVITLMIEEQTSADVVINKHDLKIIKESSILQPIITSLLEKNMRAIKDYQSGKDKALQSIVGQVMKATDGKADPELTLALIKESIK
jgi:aspartyl-tRNA(Asn)/glutamyl-tRNA(Gln) amidotransferase subunit B